MTKCVAGGADPATMTAGHLARGITVTVDSAAHVGEVLDMMEEHKISRLPVIDSHRPVGMIGEADLARHFPWQWVGRFFEAVCAG